MFTNYYNPQLSLDRINSQIAELEKLKAQIPQQPLQAPITQNFQLTPTNREVMRYANSIEEVEKDIVLNDTPFFSKDMSVLWVKNTQGQVKTYQLEELVKKDEKDLKIEFLLAKIASLEEGSKNEQCITNVDEPVKDEKSTSTSTISKSTKKSK